MACAIVQARTGSTRFPNKILGEIEGRPLIERLLARLVRSRECSGFAVATSTAAEDDALAAVVHDFGVRVVRGPLDDVLERFRLAAQALDADAIVRITGDCPLVDSDVVDAVVRTFRESSAGYVSNVRPPTFPDGLDVEVFSRAALERAAREAAMPSEREHVTLYLAEHPELFGSENVTHEPDLSAMRWTVDYPDDLEFVRAVFQVFRGREDAFGMSDVVEALAHDPGLAALMPARMRNEGLVRSRSAEQPSLHSEP